MTTVRTPEKEEIVIERETRPAASPKPASLAFPKAQETDVCYVGYAGRVMLGGFIVCVGVTAAALFAWWRWRSEFGPSEQNLILSGGLAALGAVWLFQLFRWGYRKLAYQCRLTTRRLFRHRGILHGKPDIAELARVAHVGVCRNLWERCLGAGRIYVRSENNMEKPVIVEAVARPLEVAEAIRRQAAKARDGQVVAGRVVVG